MTRELLDDFKQGTYKMGPSDDPGLLPLPKFMIRLDDRSDGTKSLSLALVEQDSDLSMLDIPWT